MPKLDRYANRYANYESFIYFGLPRTLKNRYTYATFCPLHNTIEVFCARLKILGGKDVSEGPDLPPSRKAEGQPT